MALQARRDTVQPELQAADRPKFAKGKNRQWGPGAVQHACWGCHMHMLLFKVLPRKIEPAK